MKEKDIWTAHGEDQKQIWSDDPRASCGRNEAEMEVSEMREPEEVCFDM